MPSKTTCRLRTYFSNTKYKLIEKGVEKIHILRNKKIYIFINRSTYVGLCKIKKKQNHLGNDIRGID